MQTMRVELVATCCLVVASHIKADGAFRSLRAHGVVSVMMWLDLLYNGLTQDANKRRGGISPGVFNQHTSPSLRVSHTAPIGDCRESSVPTSAPRPACGSTCGICCARATPSCRTQGMWAVQAGASRGRSGCIAVRGSWRSVACWMRAWSKLVMVDWGLLYSGVSIWGFKVPLHIKLFAFITAHSLNELLPICIIKEFSILEPVMG